MFLKKNINNFLKKQKTYFFLNSIKDKVLNSKIKKCFKLDLSKFLSKRIFFNQNKIKTIKKKKNFKFLLFLNINKYKYIIDTKKKLKLKREFNLFFRKKCLILISKKTKKIFNFKNIVLFKTVKSNFILKLYSFFTPNIKMSFLYFQNLKKINDTLKYSKLKIFLKKKFNLLKTNVKYFYLFINLKVNKKFLKKFNFKVNKHVLKFVNKLKNIIKNAKSNYSFKKLKTLVKVLWKKKNLIKKRKMFNKMINSKKTKYKKNFMKFWFVFYNLKFKKYYKLSFFFKKYLIFNKFFNKIFLKNFTKNFIIKNKLKSFFWNLESRIDFFLVRSGFIKNLKQSCYVINNFGVMLNNIRIKKIHLRIKTNDILQVNFWFLIFYNFIFNKYKLNKDKFFFVYNFLVHKTKYPFYLEKNNKIKSSIIIFKPEPDFNCFNNKFLTFNFFFYKYIYYFVKKKTF